MKKRLTPEMAAFIKGKEDYANGVQVEQCPYPKNGDLASHWIEGFQMAAYEERQRTGALPPH